MGRAAPRVRPVVAPRTTRILAELLGIGIVAQGALAGGFLGGHHAWLAWHQHLGDVLPVLPLASLVIGVVQWRRRPGGAPMLTVRATLLVLVVAVEATGHAGGSLLAVHIPVAVATMALVAYQVAVATPADRSHAATGP